MEPAVSDEFERFYLHNEGRVARFVLAMLGDTGLAADAAQETWLRYLRYVDRAEPRFDAALLIAVARNVVRTMWRRRRPEFAADLARQAGVASFEESVVMTDLIARLPYREREVIVLHYALDLSIEEIGRQINEPCSAVKSRLHRARRRLRAAYLSGEEKRYEAQRG